MNGKKLIKSFIIFFIFLLLQSCNLVKLAQFYTSENHSKPKQHTQAIEKNDENVFKFHQDDRGYHDLIANMEYIPPNFRKSKFQKYKLSEYLDEETTTTAFLVIRRDTILY